MERPEVNDWISGSEEEIAEQAAAFITAEALRAVSERGRFTLVLTGGRTPRRLYGLLARGIGKTAMERWGYGRSTGIRSPDAEPDLLTLPWQHTFLFLGDERYVPSSHPDSNYGSAWETLIMHIGIPRQQIVMMPVESGDAGKDAQRYEAMLREVYRNPECRTENGFPVFDIVMLGLGYDGHTASLFPSDREALEEDDRWAIAVDAPDAKPPVTRLTMTLPVINNAESVMFLVSPDRYELALSIRNGQRPDLPAGMVRPHSGKLYWFAADGS